MKQALKVADLDEQTRDSVRAFLDMLGKCRTEDKRVELVFNFFQRAARGGFDLGFIAGQYTQSGVSEVVVGIIDEEEGTPHGTND